MKTLTSKQKNAKSFESLKGTLNYTNTHESPRLQKIVVSSGTGSLKDKKKLELVADRLTKITGQKPAGRSAKQSIASFKVRAGDPVGYQITLRGERMFGFLDKLIHIALPRTRDFRGIDSKGIDEMGNLTIGVKEHTVFPETVDEDIKDVFGLAITIVTTAGNKKEAKAFFDYLGIPFKKAEAGK